MIKLHFEILDHKRKRLLPLLGKFKDRFYLAGGTALALQLGHRDSIDFDFFTDEAFASDELLREVKEIFYGHSVEIIQAGNMTLNLLIAGDVRVSFFCIREKMLKPFLETEQLKIASIDDIACMKICALLRAEFKDYVDLYYIFKQKTLKEVLNDCKKKYDNFDEMVYLKALVSFDDLNIATILFERGKRIKPGEIKKDFSKKLKDYFKHV